MKEPKIYFYEVGFVAGDDGTRFENFVALSFLTKLIHKHDAEGETKRLYYLRTREVKEVDFLASDNTRGIETLYEVKLNDSSVSPNLIYFTKNIPRRAFNW